MKAQSALVTRSLPMADIASFNFSVIKSVRMIN